MAERMVVLRSLLSARSFSMEGIVKPISQRSSRITDLFLAIISIYSLTTASARADKPIIYHVDLRYTAEATAAKCFDTRQVAVCVQGLVNREAPRLYLSFTDNDVNWLARITETGALCDGWEVRKLSFYQMLTFFRGYVNGLILYDKDASTGATSSSLVAMTAAGIEGGIAIRKDTASTVYNYLVNTLGIPTLLDLAGKFTGSGTIYDTATASTGSAKCDAYIWAKQKYIDTGKCDPTVLLYTLDLYGLNIGTSNDTQLQNLDYAVMKKGFCFELSPWADETPNDDLNQPLGTDLSTFKSILDACNIQTGKSEMIKLCGFPNWQYKYTNNGSVGGSHTPVDTEWQFIKILTSYNCYAEADAPNPNYVANASFYAGLLPEFNTRHYVQNPPPTYSDMVNRGLINSSGKVVSGNYMALCMSDYDQASWIMYILANPGGVFDGSNKASVCCNWGVDPNAIDRACVAMDYMYRNKTDKDCFIGWDSGAGYVNPSGFYGTREPSGYDSGLDIWQKHCKKYYRALDYSITGWMFDGASTTTTTDCSNYASFSGDGMGVWPPVDFNTPTLQDNIGVSKVETSIIDYPSGVHFAWYRVNAQATTTDLKAIVDSYASSGNNHQFLDAYTYYYLLRYYLGGTNNYRATWINDTTPRLMQVGRTYNIDVTVRNDGWDTWSENAYYRLGYAIVSPTSTPEHSDYDSRGRFKIPGGVSIAPGQNVTFSVSVVAPSTTGNYDLYFDMVQDSVTWFSSQNNLEATRSITVVSDTSAVDTDSDGTPDVTEDADGMFFWHPGDHHTLGPATPATPTDTGVYTTSTSIKFSWAAVTGAIGYYCRIGTTPGGSNIYDGYLGNYLYKILAGSIGNTYYCRIQAVNNMGYVSEWSESSDGIAVVSSADAAISGIKALPDATSIGISNKIVTAVFSDEMYIEESTRNSGIKVKPSMMPLSIKIGDLLDIVGILKTASSGERYIYASTCVRRA